MKRNSVLHFLVFLLIFAFSHDAEAQRHRLMPTHRNLAYDSEHEAQKLDVYLIEAEQPTPVMIYIHGGGWRAGSKNRISLWLQEAVREGWLSVVSVEYRFTDVAPHPAQVNDCVRAVQFVREHADEWNVDPDRIGVTGGSAGGHLSLWVGLHEDLANKTSEDRIERQSSRVDCIVSFAGPTDWMLLKAIEHRHPAYRQLLGAAPQTDFEELSTDKITDVSPISHVSSDDPPVMLVHGDQDDIVPIEHAHRMAEELKQKNVPVEMVVVPGGNHGVAGAGGEFRAKATQFVRKQFMVP